MIFVLGGFEHSIANMYYLMVGIFSNSIYGVGNAAVNWERHWRRICCR